MPYKIGKGCPPKRTQFKKGQSGNPQGARLHNQELKALKKITQQDVENIVELLLSSNLEDLKKIWQNQDTNVLTLGFVSVLQRAIKKGDWKAINNLTSFLIGKPMKDKDVIKKQLRNVSVEKILY